MKKDNCTRVFSFILTTIMIILILLIVLFLVYVYNEQKIDKETMEFIDISERKGEITKVATPEDESKEEEIVVTINPPTIANVSSNINNVDNGTNNKFYYNNLDEYSKLIYKSLDDQKEKMKTGNEIINLPSSIAELLKTEEGEKSIKAIFTIAMNAFEYDNPDIFYIDTSKMILYYEVNSIGEYKIYLKNSDEYSNYLIDGVNSKGDVSKYINDINLVVQEIENEINEQHIDTDYKKILYIHDWIVNNSKYNQALNKSNRSNIYGILKEKEATCGGYAKTFKYLMDKFNINCIIVQGKATNNNETEYHAWNYVELDEKWYGVDCTWDDPIIQGNVPEGTQKLSHTYFLKGKNVFNKSHEPFKNFYGTDVPINYPEL